MTTAQSAVELVDPVLAAAYLTRNIGNRPLDPRRVGYFVRAIRHGRWRVSGNAVAFAADGRLLNGQHRLSAIVATGRTVPVAVVRATPTG